MKRIEDERIINEKRRINSNAFGLCLIALWGIIIFRQFLLKQDAKEYIDIFLLTMSISVFVTFNNVFKGFYLTYRDKKAKSKVSLISALVGTFVFMLVQIFIMDYSYSSLEDVLELSITGIAFFGTYMGIQYLLFKISEKKADKEID